MKLDYSAYLKSVVLPIFKVGIVAIPVYALFLNGENYYDFWRTLANTIVAGVFGLFIASILGLDKNDRAMIIEIVKNRFNRK